MADNKKNSATGKKPGLFRRIGRYFKDVKGEFKKISWPTRSQALNNCMVVLAVIVAVGVAIWSFDALLSFVLRLTLNTP